MLCAHDIPLHQTRVSLNNRPVQNGGGSSEYSFCIHHITPRDGSGENSFGGKSVDPDPARDVCGPNVLIDTLPPPKNTSSTTRQDSCVLWDKQTKGPTHLTCLLSDSEKCRQGVHGFCLLYYKSIRLLQRLKYY